MTGGVARGPDRRFPVGRTAPASRVHFPSQRNYESWRRTADHHWRCSEYRRSDNGRRLPARREISTPIVYPPIIVVMTSPPRAIVNFQ
jgi:hypothetical protein